MDITEEALRGAAGRNQYGSRAGLMDIPMPHVDVAEEKALLEAPLSRLLIRIVGEVGGQLSVLTLSLAASELEPSLQRTALHAIARIGGLDGAIALATLGLDPSISDENRRQAFYGLEEIASQGTIQAQNGLVVSIDEGAVQRWEENQLLLLETWPVARIHQILKKAPKSEEWVVRARLVWGVIVTVERRVMEKLLDRRG